MNRKTLKMIEAIKGLKELKKIDPSGEVVSTVYIGVRGSNVTSFPAVFIGMIGSNVINTLGRRSYEINRYKIDCMAKTYSEAECIREAVIRVLKRSGLSVRLKGVSDLYSEEFSSYHRIQEVVI